MSVNLRHTVENYFDLRVQFIFSDFIQALHLRWKVQRLI